MQSSLLEQGLNLMLYGMGTVFVFLTLLVFATSLMSWLVGLWLAKTDHNVEQTLATDQAGESELPGSQIMAAIKAAIALHRKN